MNTIPVGENSIAVSVSGNQTSDCVREIRRLYHAVLKSNLPGIVSVRCGLDSLLIEQEPDADLVALLDRIESKPASATSAESMEIPVCYENEFGRDLGSVAEQTGRSREEIIDLHVSRTYQVWMIGFMPGFPYMGELPEILQLQRKMTPDPFIPAGSVAIAEEYTAIYPFDSPGGWHVIGRTPLSIIDYSKRRPWLFEYGMQVRFYPISAEEFGKMKS